MQKYFKFFYIFLLGFSSGLPLLLTSSNLVIIFTEKNIDIKTIGLFAFASIPYSFKFIWSPLVDYIKMPNILSRYGRRRSWIICMQVLLALSIFMLGTSFHTSNIMIVAISTLLVSSISATLDIVIDAYRIEILKEDEQALGVSVHVWGYRVAMLIAGGGALMLTKYLSWSNIYYILALLSLMSIISCIMLGESNKKPKNSTSEKLNVIAKVKEMTISPFKDFMRRQFWLGILIFIIMFKVPDAMISSVINNFYKNLGFTNQEIGQVIKLYGFIATMGGLFLGGLIAKKFSNLKCLVLAIFAQAISNLLYIWLLKAGHNLEILIYVITIENIAGAIGTVALIAYLSNLCNVEYTATQYALFSSFASLGRVFISGFSGFIVDALGWEWFFIITCILGAPGLIMFFMVKKYNNIIGV